MKKFLVAGIAAVAFSAAPALAADLPQRPPAYKAAPVAPVFDWSGFYVGGNIGGAWMHAKETFINDTGNPDPLSFRPSSVIGGGQAGLQGQWGNLVLGIEATYSGSSLKQTDPSINPGGARTRSVNVDDIGTVVGKVGFTGGSWLWYAKGGWADLRVNNSSTAPTKTSSSTKWDGGWTIGTGLEYMFANNWISGVEFDYYSAAFNGPVLFSDGTTGTVTNSRVNVAAVTARLSYKFGSH